MNLWPIEADLFRGSESLANRSRLVSCEVNLWPIEADLFRGSESLANRSRLVQRK